MGGTPELTEGGQRENSGGTWEFPKTTYTMGHWGPAESRWGRFFLFFLGSYFFDGFLSTFFCRGRTTYTARPLGLFLFVLLFYSSSVSLPRRSTAAHDAFFCCPHVVDISPREWPIDNGAGRVAITKTAICSLYIRRFRKTLVI